MEVDMAPQQQQPMQVKPTKFQHHESKYIEYNSLFFNFEGIGSKYEGS